MTNEVKYQTFRWGPLVLETKITSEFVDKLLKQGIKNRRSGKKELDARKHLEGRIEAELFYEKKDLEELFAPNIKPYVETYLKLIDQWTSVNSFAHLMPHLSDTDEFNISWSISTAWINFQKKHEYNPPHNHPCDLSFVVYLDVPKEIAAEEKTARKSPGGIYFDYGEQMPFSVKSMGRFPKKGDMFLFPGWLRHHVHSFSSNVERISVSGNIMLGVLKKDP